MKKAILTAATCLFAFPFVFVSAQDSAKPAKPAAAAAAAEKPVEAKQADKKAEAKSDEKKPSNRLPSNYGKLGLSEAQRSKIYSVQDRHESEIDELNDKLKAVKAKRDHEIEAILTPEQMKTLKDLTASKDVKGDSKDKPEAKAESKDKVEAKDKK